jgi:hypothetical protein
MLISIYFFFTVNNVGVSHYPEFFGNMKQEVYMYITQKCFGFIRVMKYINYYHMTWTSSQLVYSFSRMRGR